MKRKQKSNVLVVALSGAIIGACLMYWASYNRRGKCYTDGLRDECDKIHPSSLDKYFCAMGAGLHCSGYSGKPDATQEIDPLPEN
jgi:hypothetical protein